MGGWVDEDESKVVFPRFAPLIPIRLPSHSYPTVVRSPTQHRAFPPEDGSGVPSDGTVLSRLPCYDQ